MTSFNRDKFKASNLSAIQAQEKSMRKADKKFENSDNSRVRFYIIEDGKNILHVMPSKDPDIPAYVAMRTAQLQVFQDEYEDGEKTGRKILKGKRIFIATQHCQPVIDANLPDPIEYYIEKCYEKAEEFSDDKDKEKFLAPIKGGGSGKNWRPGIIPSSTWICYVQDIDKRELYRLELRNNWFSQLQKKSLALAEESDKVSLDMFSSPDEGFPLVITKGEKVGKGGKSQVYYEVDALKPKIGQSWDDFFATYAITDAELQRLDDQPSLGELYINSYTSRDLDLALEGLKNLEKEHPEYDILGSEDFTELVRALREVVPAAEDKEKDSVDIAFEQEAGETVTPLKMKKFLREYIAENYPDRTLPALSKDDLKEWYDLAQEGEELPFDEDEDEEEQPTPEEEKEEVEVKPQKRDPASTREALKNIINRRK